MSADRSEWASLAAALFTCAVLGPLLMYGFAGALSYRAPEVAIVVAPGYPPAMARLALQTKALSRQNPNVGVQADPGVQSEPTQSPGQPQQEPEFLLPANTIAELSAKTWRSEPLDSNAIRALAYSEDLAGKKDSARRLMQLAVKRSLHDRVARYWLLKDAVARQDFDTALSHLDMFFRTSRKVTADIIRSFASMADHPTGRLKIIEALKKNPPWRRPFLMTYPAIAKNLNGPMKIFVALKASGSEPEKDMIHAFENNLVRRGRLSQAYYVWLQTLPQEKLKNLPLLNNGDFEEKQSNSAFAWKMQRISGAQADIGRFASDKKYGRSLQVVFYGERVRYAHTRQLVMLTPGKYRFTGDYRLFNLNNVRGLLWRVFCLKKKPEQIGESSRLRGHMNAWSSFQFEFEVPVKDCPAQFVQLASAARNGPESIIAGRALFDNLNIARLKQ